jgi:hypothetical protein
MKKNQIDLSETSLNFLKDFHSKSENKSPAKTAGDLGEIIHLLKKNGGQRDFEDRYRKITSGSYYWLSFLEGYLEYDRRGVVCGDNPFFLHLRDLLTVTNFDPLLAQLFGDDSAGKKRIEQRFETLYNLLCGFNEDHPIIIYAKENPPAYEEFFMSSKEIIYADNFDGCHRIFSAVISGKAGLDCYVIY